MKRREIGVELHDNIRPVIGKLSALFRHDEAGENSKEETLRHEAKKYITQAID